ncbi:MULTISPECIES: hypothetical protein [unclassified Moorena]|uniref:hypothetical protein n=1 Tax=unclassified Moorena TaxID=2683338 RepID=UPI0013CBB14B|nr:MULTISPECIES: hypothetical protein [unclassified Moorena]NEO20622.1 hypothetical protein [Moorena sp. SIO4A5]NEQ58595.1 hypothetical protein [Moorena sp. SIO4A1]
MPTIDNSLSDMLSLDIRGFMESLTILKLIGKTNTSLVQGTVIRADLLKKPFVVCLLPFARG